MNADEKSYDDINVTPMVDLYLVLLLIFIIMTTAGVQGIKVNLPKASNAPALKAPKTQAITVNSEGKLALNTTPITLGELESRLSGLKASNPELPVVVRGNGSTQYQNLFPLLEMLNRIGISQIALATEPAK